MVWLERFDGSPAAIATLFHELVHASMVRYANSGVLRRNPTKRDCAKGAVSIDELLANSVGELRGRGSRHGVRLQLLRDSDAIRSASSRRT